MSINAGGWRPQKPESAEGAAETFTGNRALMLEEPLLFEIGDAGQTGVDFEPSCSPAEAGAQAGPGPGPRPSPG
ncbi:MAG TPA: aminomethyl-transferring glycine dehydrogenase subunit GcvPB, partial [Allosphingosinicella sp.]|nr:aminomethyl-transferring glycine dehydrogenase subunit GcvPB [Allosphingosinicella sp.]